MSIRPWRLVPTDLARARFVLASGPARHAWAVRCALIIVALACGAAASDFYWRQRIDPLLQEAAAQKDAQALARQLDELQLQLRVSGARSQELERQIDVLNQQLRECQEEVTFFRKTRDGKH